MSNTYLESDGQAVNVDLTSTVSAGDVVYVDGFLGIADDDGVNGDSIALSIDRKEYQFYVPAAFAANKGDTIYILVTDLTGHIPNDTAYGTVSGANEKALFKATSGVLTAADSTKFMTGILLPEGV